MARINGTAGHDHDLRGGKSLIGTNAADTIRGFAGDDLLDGRGGNDTLDGGAGTDVIMGGRGNDTVINGTDTGFLDGGSGADWVDFRGNDNGGDFNLASGFSRLGPSGLFFTVKNFENIRSGEGSDLITGTNGKNIIYGNAGNDVIDAGGGNDTAYGGLGNDIIDGGSGNDRLFGEFDNDTINGGNGNDLINGGTGNDRLLGGAGNDTFQGHAGIDTVDGGSGFDTLDYSSNTRAVTVDGFFTQSVSHQGSYDEQTFQSIEKFIGTRYGDGFLALSALEVDGRAGNDTIYSGPGAQKLTGGSGIDSLSYFLSDSAVDVNLGNRKASGGWAQGDRIAGFENLSGSSYADSLTGSGGANGIAGDEGNDQIKAGGGNDTIIGGAGADSLWGGSGADRFRYTSTADSPAEPGELDVIRDFSHGQGDKIDLGDLPGSLAFIGTAAFSGAGQVRVQHSGSNTFVQVNTAGSGLAEMVIQLTGTINLQAGDFIL